MARILVADDELGLQQLVRRFAAKQGHEVVTATTGAELRRLVARELPDLILLDLQLGDARGEELLLELKADARTSKIPVILWSGAGGVIDIEGARLLGAADFVEKTAMKEVMTRITRVLAETLPR